MRENGNEKNIEEKKKEQQVTEKIHKDPLKKKSAR